MKKTLISALSFVFILLAACMIHTDDVVAAEKDYLTVECTNFEKIPNAPEDGYIFAGWYQEVSCENVYNSLNGVTSAFAKFVPEEILSVKLQLKANTKVSSLTTNMRLVSSVDSLNYQEVGFEIYFNGATTPVMAKTSKVYERIEASTKSGVEYNYSPKVIDIDSDYFVTATLINISNGNFNKNFYIRPYWKTLDGTTVYGVNRYVTVMNGISTTNINVPVKVSAELTTTEVFINGVDSSLLSNASIAYYDGIYAHLNVDVANRDSILKSVNTIVVTDRTTTGTAQYRNLLTTHVIADSTEINADSTWYSDSEDAFVIATSAELYGFASLVNGGNTFAGKTVYLVTDLYMNEGKATESGWSNANPYLWTPIGQGKAFSGTFDGGMHTISGIYLEATAKSAGLFGTVQNPSGGTATVKNLVLTNSYMTSAYTNFGSIVGYVNGGKLDTVKSNAILTSSDAYEGGLVGMTGSSTEMTNCWFGGSVKNTKSSGNVRVGGLVGCPYTGSLTATNCLYSGVVDASSNTTTHAMVGGFIGEVGYKDCPGVTVTMKGCLNVGTISLNSASIKYGAIIGYVRPNCTLDIRTSYANEDNYAEILCGYDETKSLAVYDADKAEIIDATITNTSMTGYEAQTNLAGFDFERVWSIVRNENPILTSFKDEILVADTSWYDEAEGTAEDPYILYDKEDLYGLAELSKNDNFAGKVIRLGADIIVNRGNAATWDKYVPKFEWTPIGQSTAFAGTFDGSDPETGEIHSISGIYLNTSTANSGLFSFTADGSAIQNLKLTNSYFYSSAGRVGSIAGQLRGTLNTVYSDAIVISSANYAAGLAAMASNSTSYDVDIMNSWFAGTVTNTSAANKQYVGGFVAFGYAKSVDITNCLNTGTIDVSACTGGDFPFASGILAYARCETTITSCLNAGEIIVNDAMTNITYGALIGYIHSSGIVVDISNSYTDSNQCAAVCGYNNGSTTFTVNDTAIGTYANSKNLAIDGVSITDNVIGDAAKTGFANLDFDKYWTVTDLTPALTSFAGKVIAPDITWYNDSDTYVLYNAADLYGFASLVNDGNNFAGKTVKLGDDIVVNEGIASEWAITAPKHTWTPIGNKTNYFAGVFDGDMHTISGLYFDTTEQYTGLFGGIKTSGDTQATVQNLKLKNSYFESTASYLGSITGWVSNAQFDSIYSDAIVTCANSVVGGFMGMSDATVTMNNCWFNGAVANTGTGKNRTAGFVGEHYSGTLTMTNCLNSGTVDVSAYSTAAGNGNYYPKAGGFFGQLRGTANVTDCLYTGEKVLNSDATISAKTVYGAFSGYMETGAVITVTTSYADSSKCNSRGYYSGNTVTGYDASIFLAHEKVIGANATTNLTGFDFNNTWSVIADGKVVLTTFENEVADVSWYNENESEFVLKDKEDFFGFVKLSQNNNFAGKTVKLGTDIVLNEGDASEWATSVPEYAWTPIGQRTAFAGTFDGGMHTISGLYLETSTKNSGLFGQMAGTNATIQNLKLTNSYFGTSDANNVGSIVGYANGGNIDTVYSDAIVVASKERVGGFIGMGASTVAITNSWFAGTVTNASTRTGGFVGDQYSGNLSMSNCLVTGLVDVSGYTTARTFSGGFVGRVGESTSVTLNKCLNTANKRIYNAASVEYGAFTGFMDNNSSLTITNTYADSGKWGSVGYYSVKTEAANGNAVTTYSTINGLYGNDKVDTVKELLSALLLEHPDVIGDAAKTNLAGFDFNSTWTVLSDGAVALTTFADMKAIDIEKTELHSKLTLSELLTANSATKLATLPEPTNYQNLYYQGGCTTDGEYFYQAVITYKDTKPTEEDGTDKDVSNEVRVVKYNLSTGEAIWSDSMALNHANDITYNPKLDRFVVCHNAGNAKRVSYLKVNDAGKLEMDGGADLKYSSYSIDYNAIYDRYVVGRSGAEYFDVYDSDFKVLYSFEAKEEYKAQLTEDKTSYTAYITQGIACDDNYIYCVLDKPDVIVVYDWFGCFVTKIDLSNVVDYEPENISIVGNSIYVTDVFYYNTELFGQEIELTRAYVYKIDASALVKDASEQ